ncbi:MAG: sodium:solute symporter family protein [Balneolaceae bacterium]|nr:sodium:solute symporter family protein [Balneolaceae bacterium]MBO6547457.1 sodium:solute symporter family protein [Balneolaceae bacterium]MBO6647596.1 sodium:solute symporter family protein [Balneolaceae bacterium]
MPTTEIIIICIGLYLLLLITIGILSRRNKSSGSLKDHYLAGGNLGAFVLLLTLYATQYSANTLLVTPAEVVNKGFSMILILGYMTSVVIFYLTFAPQLYKISRKADFITPGDWFDFRFKLPKLTLFSNTILIIVSVNFLLSQLIAMGHIASGFTEGKIPYWAGVVFLALIVILYETLGGMRAVAWTDVLQGIMLIAGLIGMFLIFFPDVEQLNNISKWLIENEPEKINLPDANLALYWGSTVLMIGIGAAVYPQAIQRIYAAKTLSILKKSIGAMVFMPFITVLVLFFLGVISIPHFVESESISTDSVLPIMLEHWGSHSQLSFVLMVMIVVSLLAAIMSTADSVLLTLSSIISKDVLGKTILKSAPEEKITKYGKTTSWVIMGILIIFALQPRITLWGLIELKMQILIQIAPLFILGVHSTKVTSKGVFAGLCVGSIFAICAFFLDIKTIAGIQIGLIGFIINVICCFTFSKKASL